MNIIQTAANRTGIAIEQITGSTRKREVVMVRHCLMWVMRNKLRMTLSNIGRLFDRDHTSVIHGIACVNNYLYTDDELYMPTHNKIVIGVRREGTVYCYDCDGIIVQNYHHSSR